MALPEEQFLAAKLSDLRAEAEEAADAAEQVGLPRCARIERRRGERLARTLQVAAPGADHALHFVGDLRPRLQQLLERAAVQAPALDVGLGHHRRGAGV